MQNEEKLTRLCLRSAFCILTSALFLGCAEYGPTLQSRQARRDDTPFGGGFPANQRPSSDPFDRDSHREVVQVKWPAARVGEPALAADEKFMQERR